MTDLTQQLEERARELGQHLEKAAETAERIETATNNLTTEAAEIFAYVEEPTTDLQTFSSSVLENIEAILAKGQQDIKGAVEVASSQIEEQQTKVTTSVNTASIEVHAWVDFEKQVSTFLSEFRESAAVAFETIASEWKDQKADLVSNTDRVEEALSQLSDDLNKLGDEAEQSISQTINSWVEHTTSQGEKLAEDHKKYISDTFSKSGEALNDTLKAEAEKLKQIQDLLREAIDNAASQWLEEQKDKFIETLEDIVKREISEAIIVSQFGATTTGALTPYMPALITVKHSADTLLELIEVWKQTKEGFGL
ncbi:MAG: hypothetical protein GYB33_09675 [Gammaproteobacteria bacterium]|nr:hypothetical protein [Gammaproteobacteria bacterium]